MTVTEFRQFLTFFSNVTIWPDDIVQIGLDEGHFETCRWSSSLKDRGQAYYAAHWLLSMYPRGGDSSPSSGNVQYAIDSKSVGDESISFNNGSLSNESSNDSWLASTVYGLQFKRLRTMNAMGARAV